jgi:2-iminobutanoate/2-iminopropanoate deaminase
MKIIIFSLAFILGSFNVSNAQDYYMPVSSKSKIAIKAYQQADDSAANAEISAAKEQLKQALAAYPNFFMAYTLSIYLSSSEEAIDLIDKALALKSSEFSRAERIIREQLMILDKDPKANIADNLKKLVAAFPTTPQAYQWAALQSVYRNGDGKAALDYSQQLMVLLPDYGPIHNVRGYVYLNENEMDKAKTAFEKYIALSPEEANAYDSMAEYYMTNKEYAKSVEYYDKAYSMGMSEGKERAATVRRIMRETPEYFNLRPETEKAFGYSHAVKIGNDIKISGAVSMDDAGNPTAVGDLEQQMKNCYADLEKILKHYGCTFVDVVVENVFTTNMSLFLEKSAYRNSIYTKQFPAGSWLGVKELALPGFMIEIELEVHKAE